MAADRRSGGAPARRSGTESVFVPLLPALALMLAAGCRAQGPAAAAAPPGVVVARVTQRDVPVAEEWVGTTAGTVSAEIRPKVDGYVLRRAYQEGSYVRRGDLLFVIDARQAESQLAEAQATLQQAQSDLAKATRDVERFTPLAAEQAVSQQELDNAVSARQAATAAVAARKAAVEQARLSRQWTRVTSPIAGVAGLAQGQVGDLVGPQTVLTTVAQVDPIRVLFSMGEQEYLRFQRSHGAGSQTQALELVLSDGTLFPEKGRLTSAGGQVDVKTGSMTMIAEFPNPGNLLRAGQYAKVRGVLETKRNALLVPQRALSEMQGSYQLAVVAPDGTAQIRVVQPSQRVGSSIVIDQGIAAGERVVIEGFSRVKSGQRVTAQEAAAASPAAASAGGR
jgi:membrane fusion protein (multidrug efflux system)